MKTKIWVDFHVYISVPLSVRGIDDHCIINRITKIYIVNVLENADLTEKRGVI